MSQLPTPESSNQSIAKRRFIQVCQYRSCQRFNAAAVLAELKQHASAELMVAASSCLGQCGSGPTVRVVPDNVWYCRVSPKDVDAIIEQHIRQGSPVKRLLHPRFHPDYERLLERLKSQSTDS
ncbi:2fe-2s ferredoxin [Leptolyngbya sp. Heron Island J]|uniref:(2Fe-2S) ferredoxin domain-containing protein n=1 Tax=Leptolyngbya sp. Heron Island J TaxID=1385935 RepID=UPI0003B9E132|nr:(2Fe-2S) ferredoxin domain-containing protein [Leptolyngbya sp. Heron Island J]ESA36086.1 2fe-2s ferredoxin [Leptolyngbya sp. Heron Island J]